MPHTHLDLVLIADTHQMHRDLEVPPGDILIHAGDFTTVCRSRGPMEDFNRWLGDLPHKHKIVVPGNHEFVLEENPRLRSLITNAAVLIDELATVEGLRIWGSPMTPMYGGAFGRSSEKDRRAAWSRVPEVDVLVTHGPPLGILDEAPGELALGDMQLLEAVQRIRPLLHVFGHIHGAHGQTHVDDTLFVNCAMAGEGFAMNASSRNPAHPTPVAACRKASRATPPAARGHGVESHHGAEVPRSATGVRMADEISKSSNPLHPASQDRRTFLKTGGAVAAGLIATAAVPAHAADANANVPTRPANHAMPFNPRTHAAMPTRNLGKTGYKVGIFSLGGQAALERANNFDVAVPIIEKALDLGVNYLDTSSIYGGPDRWSEQYVGKVMAKRRNEAFLATKTKERTKDGSMRMIEKSLQLLNTDHVDLWQLHDIGEQKDVDAVFAKGGAMEALIEMHQQGVVRNLGVTGHYRPDALIECINRYPFDCILMSLSAADGHLYSFQEKLLPLAVEKQMGIIGMKVPARGRLLSNWNPPPVEAQKHMWEGSAIATRPGVMTMKQAVDFVWTHPVSTVIIGVDNQEQLQENVSLAHEFTPLSQTQMTALNDAAAPVAKQSLFFRFTDRTKG